MKNLHHSKLIVCGGAAGIGFWFTEYLHTISEVNKQNIYIYDLPDSLEKNKNNIAPYQDRLLSPSHSTTFIGNDDIIIVAIPADQIDALMGSLRASHETLKSCHILNLCSVQASTRKKLLYLLPQTLIGIHFLFGPEITQNAGNRVALVAPSEEQNHPLFQFWKKNFADNSFATLTTTPEDHDKTMLQVQVAIHFLYFSYAHYLSKQGISMEDILPYLTPIARAFLSSVAHTLLQTKQTYANIQAQPGAETARDLVWEALQECRAEFKQPIEGISKFLDTTTGSFSEKELKDMQKLFLQ